VARHELDKGTKVGGAYHLARIDLADLSLGGECLDARQRLRHGVAVRRGDGDDTIVIDIDADTCLVNDTSDRFAARADQRSNLGDGYRHRGDSRRIGRDLGTRSGQGGVHHIEHLEAPHPGLFQSLLNDFIRQPGYLDVQLNSRNALFGACDLKVHVAQMVLKTLDVRQERISIAAGNEPHGDSGDGRSKGHPGIKQSQAAGARAGHGGRPVRRDGLRDRTDGIGEIVCRG